MLNERIRRLLYSHVRGQLAYYRLLEEQGHVRPITTRARLNTHWESSSAWKARTPS
jgi:membrane dipeptidase